MIADGHTLDDLSFHMRKVLGLEMEAAAIGAIAKFIACRSCS